MRLLVTRPEPEAEVTARKLRAAGHEVIVEPMLEVGPVSGVTLPLDDVVALVVTSANALRALEHHPELPGLTALPLFAVGAATGELGRRMGFRPVVTGPGTAAGLTDVIAARVPPGSTLLHLAGDVLAVDMTAPMALAGLTLRIAVVYQTDERKTLSVETANALRTGALDGITILSPRTARVLARLCDAAGLSLDGITAYCLSEACAGALRPTAARIRVAARPDLPAVLELIVEDTAQLPGRS
jgi:uroporphyrinogen-III synthase